MTARTPAALSGPSTDTCDVTVVTALYLDRTTEDVSPDTLACRITMC